MFYVVALDWIGLDGTGLNSIRTGGIKKDILYQELCGIEIWRMR